MQFINERTEEIREAKKHKDLSILLIIDAESSI